MPTQEIFMERDSGGEHYTVLKSYDTNFAKEAFDGMDDAALQHLSRSLDLEANFDIEDIPTQPDSVRSFLWDVLCEASREEGQKVSFFIVSKTSPEGDSLLYVSGDWPSAESYVMEVLA